MTGVHIAHDCHIANNVILVNSVQLGGHVEIAEHAIIGGISNENFHEVAELNFDMIALSNAIFNSQDTAKSASFFVNNFNFE